MPLLVLLAIGLTGWWLVRRAQGWNWERLRPFAHYIRLTIWEDVRYIKNSIKNRGDVMRPDH